MSEIRKRSPTRWRPLALGAIMGALSAGCDATSSTPQTQASSRKNIPMVQPQKHLPSAAPAPSDVPRSLERAMDMARNSLEEINEIEDYTCTFVKRERVSGELLEEQRLVLKVRHEPFSVYMRFLKPPSLSGQEAIYVAGRNEGKLLGHTTGLKKSLVGTLALEPTGFLAMMGNRYPITNAGMKRLLAMLIDLGEREGILDDATVDYTDADVDGRPATLVEIHNPAPQGDFKLARARIWIDKEWNLPVRFEAYEWPPGGGKAILVEQYTYLNLKFNQGLTDKDFDPGNPAYEFP